ncbi:hypothetical protein E2320_012522 [Naja naja]|nr:hypothetical protein E2320_012522 [Naja naja]
MAGFTTTRFSPHGSHGWLGFCLLGTTPMYPHNLQGGVRRAVKRAKAKILEAQTTDGVYGNIYSSPLAVQFLSAVGMRQNQQEFSSGMAALRQSLEQGDFQNNLIQSQLLPALYCKSYVDVASMACQTQTETFGDRSDTEYLYPARSQESLSVTLPTRPGGSLGIDSPGRAGSRSQRRSPAFEMPLFWWCGGGENRYETQKTLSGPMLTGVMGETAQVGEHKYWRIVRHPNSSLDQGIAEYTPRKGDHIILKMTSW